MAFLPEPTPSWPGQLRSTWLPTCHEVSHRHSQALDRRLRFAERCGWMLHLAFCRLCRRWGRQLRFLHQLSRRPEAGQSLHFHLPPEARQRLIRRLREAVRPPPSASHSSPHEHRQD